MKRLFFVRHGQTDLNVQKRFAGHTVAMLTDEGKQQAIAAGKHAKGNIPAIDLVITSTFQRAVDTAKIIAHELDYPEEKIEMSELFIERSFGELDGTFTADFFKDHTYVDTDTVANAETVEELQLRAKRGLDYLISRPEENILLVGHGAYGRALRRVVFGQPYTLEFEKLQTIDNAEIVELI